MKTCCLHANLPGSSEGYSLGTVLGKVLGRTRKVVCLELHAGTTARTELSKDVAELR